MALCLPTPVVAALRAHRLLPQHKNRPHALTASACTMQSRSCRRQRSPALVHMSMTVATSHSRAHPAVLLHSSACTTSGPLTRVALSGEVNSQGSEPTSCSIVVRFALPRATQSRTPGHIGGAKPFASGVFFSRNVMVLFPYSKSFFASRAIGALPYSAGWICKARGTPARSMRAPATANPAERKISVAPRSAPAPSSTTRSPLLPSRRWASAASAR